MIRIKKKLIVLLLYAIWLIIAATIFSKFLELPFVILEKNLDISNLGIVFSIITFIISIIIFSEILTTYMPISLIIGDDLILAKSVFKYRQFYFSEITQLNRISIKNAFGESTCKITYMTNTKKGMIIFNQSEYNTKLNIVELILAKTSLSL